MKVVKCLIAIALIAAVGVAAYMVLNRPDDGDVDVRRGEIERIEQMVRMCAVDVYSEVPVLDTINSKVMFGIQKQRGSVSFDLGQLEADASGDTVRVTLPPEIVELYEATDDNSWEVIDTKATGPLSLLRSDKFSIEEENAVKAGIAEKSRRQLYANGTVARARAEGASNLQKMLQKVYGKPVVVTDPTPAGAHADD